MSLDVVVKFGAAKHENSGLSLMETILCILGLGYICIEPTPTR